MMKIENILKLTIIFFTPLWLSSLYAQVTIGMDEIPESGALLQIKELKTSGSEANSSKGILLPRVNLVSRTSLVPTLKASEENEGEKQKHTGLVVFNVNVVPNPDASLALEEGVYIWDGTQWKAGKKKNNGQTTNFIVPVFASVYYVDTQQAQIKATVSSNAEWVASVTDDPNNLISLITTSGPSGKTEFLFNLAGINPAKDLNSSATITFTSVTNPQVVETITFDLKQTANGYYFPELNVVFGGGPQASSQSGATTYCANLSPAGTWRVPNLYELASAFAIIKMNGNAPVANYGFVSGNYYWSSTKYNTSFGRTVLFSDGVTTSDQNAGAQAVFNSNTPYRVICVKPIQ
ncbi:DUF1566 domain-containing protein [Apibacter raozihei]|uniref:DUF1566 domain-containing protein n=1 Tax=Apibacter raozihei TaxID=2500547 RepID=UPI000FE35957|nr:DUF1566 domain-containing protein [Apibacter raozihei]